MSNYNYDLTMVIAKAIKNVIDEVIELDDAMDKIRYETSNNTKNNIHKDCLRYDDNLVAIDMLKDVTKIIEGIERNDARDIKNGLRCLKDHTVEFEKVFDYFLSTGSYNY